MSIFTKIINKEIPAYRIYEDDKVISFLALGQINLGHCLVVPKTEVDHFFDVEAKEYEHMFKISKKISKAIKSVTDCVRVGVAVQGFEVHHAHIHLIPLWKPEEFSFANQKERAEEDMLSIQKKILEALKL